MTVFNKGDLVRVRDGAIPGGPGTRNMVGDGEGLYGVIIKRVPLRDVLRLRWWVVLQNGQNNIYYHEGWLEKVA